MRLCISTSVSQRSSGTQVRICHRRLTKNFREHGHCLLTVFGSYEHARACSGRLLERRRGLIARGLMPCKANTATAAEMARMLLYIGRDAQEAAASATEVARAA